MAWASWFASTWQGEGEGEGEGVGVGEGEGEGAGPWISVGSVEGALEVQIGLCHQVGLLVLTSLAMMLVSETGTGAASAMLTALALSSAFFCNEPGVIKTLACCRAQGLHPCRFH